MNPDVKEQPSDEAFRAEIERRYRERQQRPVQPKPKRNYDAYLWEKLYPSPVS